MGVMLEVEVPQEVFSRRIQPFGVALAEVSWRMRMFTYDGVVLTALYLEEPNLIIALSFWPRREDAHRYLTGAFAISLYAADSPQSRVRLDVQLDAATVEELFVAAALINARPSHTSAQRAEQHFADFLNASFPGTLVAWSRAHRWRKQPRGAESKVQMRVG